MLEFRISSNTNWSSNIVFDIWYDDTLFLSTLHKEKNAKSFYMGAASGLHPYTVRESFDPFAQLQPQGNMQCAWKSN